MSAADILLGKTGGLTTSEALAKGLAFVIFNPIPGQEERNSDHLLENGIGIRCNDLPALSYSWTRCLFNRNDWPRCRRIPLGWLIRIQRRQSSKRSWRHQNNIAARSTHQAQVLLAIELAAQNCVIVRSISHISRLAEPHINRSMPDDSVLLHRIRCHSLMPSAVLSGKSLFGSVSASTSLRPTHSVLSDRALDCSAIELESLSSLQSKQTFAGHRCS